MKIIAAVSPSGVIGSNGKIPWYYPGELKYFRAMTINKTIIMGRKTYESIGKPLPDRRNIVVTSGDIAGVECAGNLNKAIDSVKNKKDIWFVGGGDIYLQAMDLCEEMWISIVPNKIEVKDEDNVVRFPFVNPNEWIHTILPEGNVDDKIDKWHDGKHKGPIHEWLGLTLEQYMLWVQNIRIVKYARSQK